MTGCPLGHLRSAPAAACPFCRKALADPRLWGLYAALMARLAAAAPPPRGCRGACPYEGEVVETPVCDCPGKAVRWCLFEGWDNDRCTRGPNNGAVPSCSTCPHHPEAGG